jgi:hypothetical protein
MLPPILQSVNGATLLVVAVYAVFLFIRAVR